MAVCAPKTARGPRLTRCAPVPRLSPIAGCCAGGRAGGATGSHSGGGDGGGAEGDGDGDKDRDEDRGEDGDCLRRRMVASSSVVSVVPASPCIWSSCCSLTARNSPGD